MNCEVCCEKFKGIEDLIKHESTGSHQETVAKHQNALLDCPANAILPIAFANEASLSVESVPVLDESIHILSAPVHDDDTSNVPSVKASIVNLFTCTVCLMSFCNLSNTIQHTESMLHMIMVLATGIGFDEQPEINEDDTDLFPKLYYCIVCNFCCFNSKLYDVHLKTLFHGEIVQRLGNLFKESTTDVCGKETTSDNSSDLPVQHYCKLCNIQFDNTKCLKRHLNKKKHQRILPILKKIFYQKKRNFGACFNGEQTGNLIPPQYYCVLCNISVDSKLYENHLKWKNHIRIEQYINTIYKYCGISDNDIDILYDSDGIKKFGAEHKRLYHCKDCSVWCFGDKSIARHLNGKKHCSKTRRKQFEPASLSKSPDLPSSIFCDTCNIRCGGSKNFENHLKKKTHLRVAQIVNKLSQMKENGSSESSFDTHADDDNKSTQFSYYCKLCDVQCFVSKNYDPHLKGKNHKKIEMIVNALSNNTD